MRKKSLLKPQIWCHSSKAHGCTFTRLFSTPAILIHPLLFAFSGAQKPQENGLIGESIITSISHIANDDDNHHGTSRFASRTQHPRLDQARPGAYNGDTLIPARLRQGVIGKRRHTQRKRNKTHTIAVISMRVGGFRPEGAWRIVRFTTHALVSLPSPLGFGFDWRPAALALAHCVRQRGMAKATIVLRSPCALWLCGSEQVRMQLAPIEEECLWKWVQQVNGFQPRFFFTFLGKCVRENASYLENIYSKVPTNHCSRSRFRSCQRKPGICTKTRLDMTFIYRIVCCGAETVKIRTTVSIRKYFWSIPHMQVWL